MNKLKASITLFLVAAGVALGLSLTVANAAVGPGGVGNAIVPDRSAAPKTVQFAVSSTGVLTADANSASQSLKDYGVLDFQYAVVAAAGSNPFTLTLQHSNDNVYWDTGVTITNIAATTGATVMTRTHNYGAFTRVAVDVTTANAVTLTLSATAR